MKFEHLSSDDKVVCTLTGNGVKDPDTAIAQSTTPMISVEANMDAVKKAIFDIMA